MNWMAVALVVIATAPRASSKAPGKDQTDPVREALRAAGLARLAGPISALALPSIRLTPVKDGSGKTRLGGQPELPDAVQWPSWKGQPLSFVAQVDLGEMQNAAPNALLPKAGVLAFFYDREQQTWGFDPADRGSWRVLYFPAGTVLHPRPFPESLKESRFTAVPLRASAEATLPPEEDLPATLSLDDDAAEKYRAARERLASGGDARHRLLGHPELVQNPMQLECQLASNGIYVGDPEGFESPRAKALAPGAGEWRLLLQVDSESAAGMTWGDMGRLYFWIRESDLKQQKFDRVWMVLQCG